MPDHHHHNLGIHQAGRGRQTGVGRGAARLPLLAAPFSLLGLVGIGKASLDPFYSSWDGLDDPQRTELPGSAVDAEETMPGFLTGQSA